MLGVRKQALDASTCLPEHSLKTGKPRAHESLQGRARPAGALANSSSGSQYIIAPLRPRNSAAICFHEGLKQASLSSLVCLTLESGGWSLLSVVEPEVSELSPTSPAAVSLGNGSAGCPQAFPVAPSLGFREGILPDSPAP